MSLRSSSQQPSVIYVKMQWASAVNRTHLVGSVTCAVLLGHWYPALFELEKIGQIFICLEKIFICQKHNYKAKNYEIPTISFQAVKTLEGKKFAL